MPFNVCTGPSDEDAFRGQVTGGFLRTVVGKPPLLLLYCTISSHGKVAFRRLATASVSNDRIDPRNNEYSGGAVRVSGCVLSVLP